jgi:hypothetical protein
MLCQLLRRQARTKIGIPLHVLYDGVVAQSGIAQPGGKALVAAMSDLAVDQQAEPIGMGNATC